MNDLDRLKQVVHDIINGDSESAEVNIHDVFISKTREIAGLNDTKYTNGDDNNNNNGDDNY